MPTKFYHADNSNRRIGSKFVFEPYTHVGGSWSGIYATDNERDQAELDVIVGTERSAVTEISAEEFAKCDSKKAGLPESFRASNPVAKRPDALIVGDSVNSTPLPPLPKPELASVEDALKVGEVSTPNSTPAPAQAATPPVETPAAVVDQQPPQPPQTTSKKKK